MIGHVRQEAGLLPEYVYSRAMIRHLIIFLSLCFLPLMASAQEVLSLPQDNTSAVILVYHRVGEDFDPASSIREEQFSSHVRELISGGYNILPLPKIVEALNQGRSLPEHTIAITFDGAYRSAYEKAMPALIEHNIPFTVFIAPHALEENDPQYVTLADFKKLARSKMVTFGLHPDSYTRLNGVSEQEIRRQVNNAITRYRELLNDNPSLFAYPFGEYSRVYRDSIVAAGFKAAFGQQSGVSHADSDLFALPRFSMTEAYGDEERFRLVVNALPLPVSDLAPSDPYLTTHTPSIGFTLDEALAGHAQNLSCFAADQERIRIEYIGQKRVELRLEKPFDEDRVRINCTLPVPSTGPDEMPRWRWLGLLLTFSSQT
jgi:poly-beta-1,6-N-acetyl-D-glucosamine N-deacetylase